jgi:hypothetical protein
MLSSPKKKGEDSMNIDQLRARFPDENACRQFFEFVIWQHGRFCPHCQSLKSYSITGCNARQDFTNAHNANGNLPLPPKLQCTAPSLLCGSGYWSSII